MSKKKNPRNYYSEEQEEAVIAYLNSTNPIERDMLYRTYLQDAFDKMIESIIRTYKLYRKSYEFVDLHADALSFLITKFDKFNPETGKKSYSYFGTIIKNYLYSEMMKEYKKATVSSNIDDTEQDFLYRSELIYTIDEFDFDFSRLIEDIYNLINKELENTEINSVEKMVGESLINILENWKDIFNQSSDFGKNSRKFNKNLILLYIRNMTGLSTKEIRQGLKRYKCIYFMHKNDFIENID